MNYFNFFYATAAEKRQKGVRGGPLLVCGIVIVLVCAGVYLYHALQASRYQAQLDYLEEIRMDPAFIRQYSGALSVSSRIGEAEQDLSYTELLEEYLAALGTANPALLNLIEGCMPEEVQLEKIDLQKTALILEGQAADMEQLIRIERDLRGPGAFSAVLVSRLEREEELSGAPEETEEEEETDTNDTEETAERPISFRCQLELNGGAVADG